MNAAKRSIRMCDLLIDKTIWDSDSVKLKQSKGRIFAAAAPTPYKDWFVTGGYQGKYRTRANSNRGYYYFLSLHNRFHNMYNYLQRSWT